MFEGAPFGGHRRSRPRAPRGDRPAPLQHRSSTLSPRLTIVSLTRSGEDRVVALIQVAAVAHAQPAVVGQRWFRRERIDRAGPLWLQPQLVPTSPLAAGFDDQQLLEIVDAARLDV